MIKRPKVMTADDVIHELDRGDYFLDKLDDPQEPILLESDNEFSDLEDIDDDDHANNKEISVSSMYQYIYLLLTNFLVNAYLSSTLHLSTSVVVTTYHSNQIFVHHMHYLLCHYNLLFCQHLPSKHLNHHYYLPFNH